MAPGGHAAIAGPWASSESTSWVVSLEGLRTKRSLFGMLVASLHAVLEASTVWFCLIGNPNRRCMGPGLKMSAIWAKDARNLSGSVGVQVLYFQTKRLITCRPQNFGEIHLNKRVLVSSTIWLSIFLCEERNCNIQNESNFLTLLTKRNLLMIYKSSNKSKVK